MKYLNKIKGIVLLAFALGTVLQACKKDPGNYTYTELNEVMVSNLDSFYSVKPGDVLHIAPKFTYTKDLVGDTLNYEYSWREVLRVGDPTPGKPKVLAKGTILNLTMTGSLGMYNYALRVTDKKTGVWKEFSFQVLKANRFYEGWLLLSETSSGQSRLDMLSYMRLSNNYEFIPDVLKAAKSALILKGKPSFVAYDDYKGPSVGTSELATFLGVDSLEYSPYKDFSVYSENHKNVAIGPGSKLESGTGLMALWANDNVYVENGSAKLYQINTMVTETTPFKAAPFLSYSRDFVAGYRDGIILFNETTSEFVWNPKNSIIRTCSKIANESLFSNKTNKDLLFMKLTSYNGYDTFAILKDKTTNKVYLARFDVSKQYYYAEITSPDIAAAEQFEVSDDFGYIFYSVGGKLYEYDFIQNQGKEMANYGAREISLLKFQNIANTSNTRYREITKRLCVCTYEEGKLDNSGAMDIYSVPPIGGQLVKEESFSGMGKIVSITYRDR